MSKNKKLYKDFKKACDELKDTIINKKNKSTLSSLIKELESKKTKC